MAPVSPVRYAPVGNGFVAYRVAGNGTPVVLINDWFGHQRELWDTASPFHEVLHELARAFTLITFDKRGVGMSDPLDSPFLPTLEDWSADVIAVLDAAGIERATIIGKGSGGAMAMVTAATFPERVNKLVLVNAWARLTQAADFPHGVDSATAAALVAEPYMAPESIRWLLGGPNQRAEEWLADYSRASAGPGLTLRMRRWLLEVDVRAVLGVIAAPTLVVARRHGWSGAGQAGYLAAAIEGAHLTILPGSADYMFAGDVGALLNEVIPFLGAPTSDRAIDRALKTIMFTDIVDSTRMAAELGDAAWHRLLDHHDAVVSTVTAKWGGTMVKHTGDGVMLTFDGPARALHCAQDLQRSLRSIDLALRFGVHTGEAERRGDDYAGLAVHIAARVMGGANPDEIAVSRTVKDLVIGGGFAWIDLGERALKGVPERWHLYRLEPAA